MNETMYWLTCSTLKSCPSGGNWCTWSSWGDCSVTCGVGRRLRTRQVGSHCSGQSSVDEKACILQVRLKISFLFVWKSKKLCLLWTWMFLSLYSKN